MEGGSSVFDWLFRRNPVKEEHWPPSTLTTFMPDYNAYMMAAVAMTRELDKLAEAEIATFEPATQRILEDLKTTLHLSGEANINKVVETGRIIDRHIKHEAFNKKLGAILDHD